MIDLEEFAKDEYPDVVAHSANGEELPCEIYDMCLSNAVE